MRSVLSESSEESRRLRALKATNLLDTSAEARFDRITRMAQNAFGTKIALVSLIDADRQWFKSNIGLDATETSRDVAFCDHAIRTPNNITVILDASKDSRFSENPLVTGDPNISFYAGAPLVTDDGHALGTLCVIDTEPRSEFRPEQAQLLSDLAETVMSEITYAAVQQDNAELQELNENLDAENADLNLINEELQHRMGNMYAHISGLVSILGRTDASREQLIKRLRNKITVLSHTQTLLAQNDYSPVSLRELSEITLAPFGFRKGEIDGRISIQSDDDILVTARAAFTLTLMLNELATNALKHGALGNDAGEVIFSWRMLPSPKLSWIEHCVGSTLAESPKSGKGFGMQILSRIVPADFQGEASFDISPTGLSYHVTVLESRLLGSTEGR